MIRRGQLVLTVVLFCGTSVLGAQVVLNNGDRVSGTIVKGDGTTLTVATEAMGPVAIPWSAVRQLVSEQPLYFTTKDQGVLKGTVTTEGTDLVVATTAGPVHVPLASAPGVRSVAEEVAFERAQHPGLLEGILGSLSGGYTLARGNSQVTNLSLAFNAVRTTPHDRTSLYYASLYAADQTGTTANDERAGIRYDHNIVVSVFGFVSADLEHDPPQLLTLRQVYTVGLGSHVIHRDSTTLDLLGGVNYTREVYTPTPTNSLAGATLGEDLSLGLGQRTRLTEEAFVYPDLTETGQYRATVDVGFLMSLKRWLNWQAAVSDRYVSNPPPGTKQNDFTLTTGLNVTFSR
jgi:putative salt-induced outer membrane protein YdiY